MYSKGESTGSNKANRTKVNRHNLEIQIALNAVEEELLYDPQTSGGLILAIPNREADKLVENLQRFGVLTAVKIAEIIEGPTGIVVA